MYALIALAVGSYNVQIAIFQGCICSSFDKAVNLAFTSHIKKVYQVVWKRMILFTYFLSERQRWFDLNWLSSVACSCTCRGESVDHPQPGMKLFSVRLGVMP